MLVIVWETFSAFILPVDTSDEDGQESEGWAEEIELELRVTQSTRCPSGGHVVAGVARQPEEEVEGEHHARGHGRNLKGDTSHDKPVSDIE
jgi:hypothetical protein